MLLFIDKVTTRIYALVLFFQNTASDVNVCGTQSVAGLPGELASISGVLCICDIIHFLKHDQSSFISQ